MSRTQDPLALARELRQAFDRSFRQPLRQPQDGAHILLAIRVGEQPYALRLEQVSGIWRDRPITWLPSSLPELLGLSSFRGSLLPVYDLSLVIGGAKTVQPRWLVTTSTRERVALAFDELEGQIRSLPADIVREAPQPGEAQPHAELVRSELGLRPVLDVSVIFEALERGATRIGEER